MDDFDYVLEFIEPLTNIYLSSGKYSLKQEEREILAVYILDSEVNNGGFDQFYWNSSGDLALEAVEGFTSIGSDERASIVESANAEFPNKIPEEHHEKRKKQLDEIQKSVATKLNNLDDEYYRCKDDIYSLLAAYIRENMKST